MKTKQQIQIRISQPDKDYDGIIEDMQNDPLIIKLQIGVEKVDKTVHLSGRVHSFFTKQVIQERIRRLYGDDLLINNQILVAYD